MKIKSVLFLITLAGLLKPAFSNEIQLRMLKCANLASIYARHGPEKYSDLFRSHERFFSLTGLTLGDSKEIKSAEIKKMNESIQTNIEAAYKKNPAAVLKESAICSQWMDQLKEAAQTDNFNYAKTYPKTVENTYTEFHSRFIDETFREWINVKLSNSTTANSQPVPNLYCSTKSPGGQVSEGLLSVDTKNNKVTFNKAKNLDAEINSDSIRFSLRSVGIPVDYVVNRYSGTMSIFHDGSIIGSGTCEKAAQKKF